MTAGSAPILAACVLLLSLSCPSSLLASERDSADAVWEASVKNESAPVYSQPSLNSRIVATAARGEALAVDLEMWLEDGQWCKVTLASATSLTGYMRGNDLLIEKPSEIEDWRFQPPPEPKPPESGPELEKAELVRVTREQVEKLVREFFETRGSRWIPISAMGQTAFHERRGLDHSNAIDVALHPDSLEGQLLMTHLRRFSIPFVAFREKVPRAATGAHIHVGNPSPRR
jgi:hypothetical protein